MRKFLKMRQNHKQKIKLQANLLIHQTCRTNFWTERPWFGGRRSNQNGYPTTDPQQLTPQQLIPNNWPPNNWSPNNWSPTTDPQQLIPDNWSPTTDPRQQSSSECLIFGDQLLGISCRESSCWGSVVGRSVVRDQLLGNQLSGISCRAAGIRITPETIWTTKVSLSLLLP